MVSRKIWLLYIHYSILNICAFAMRIFCIIFPMRIFCIIFPISSKVFYQKWYFQVCPALLLHHWRWTLRRTQLADSQRQGLITTILFVSLDAGLKKGYDFSPADFSFLTLKSHFQSYVISTRTHSCKMWVIFNHAVKGVGRYMIYIWYDVTL